MNYGQVYVLDNNALSFLRQEHRASNFIKMHCQIPQDVLREAEGFPDIDELRHLEYPMTESVLARLTEVMATVQVGDTSLVDLYANMGNADPMVVATALDGVRGNESALFGVSWAVVTDDKAVRAKAEEFELRVISNQEFLTIVEATLDRRSHER